MEAFNLAVTEFLKHFGTKVEENEKPDYVELMMDDHFCVTWEGTQYYVPENNSLYEPSDNAIVDYLEYSKGEVY